MSAALTPEQAAAREAFYGEGGVVSCLRTAHSAAPEKQLRVFEMMARDALALADRAGLDRVEVIDEFNNLAVAVGITEREGVDEVQAALARATTAATSRTTAESVAHEVPQNDVLESICAADITMRAIRWLWPNRFALGKLGIIGGLPDRGKGLITADMIARVTKGGAWPCREGVAHGGNVILLTAEDDIEDTVVPRLVAAGADMKRVHIVRMVKTKAGGKRQFSLISDLALLERKLREIGDVVLIVIDPMSAYLGVNKIDSYRTSDVRGVLTPLADLAAEQKAAVVGVMHFNKNTNVTNAMLRLSDSLAFVAAARHAYVVVDEPDTPRRLFTKAKNNLSPDDTKALAYTIDAITVGCDDEMNTPIVAPRVVWAADHVNITASQALAAERAESENEGATAKQDAQQFLAEALADGPVLVTELEVEARAARHLKEGQAISQYKPFRDAKEELQIKSARVGFGRDAEWYWHLPKHSIDALKGHRCPQTGEGINGEKGHLWSDEPPPAPPHIEVPTPPAEARSEQPKATQKPPSRPPPKSDPVAPARVESPETEADAGVPDFLSRRLSPEQREAAWQRERLGQPAISAGPDDDLGDLR